MSAKVSLLKDKEKSFYIFLSGGVSKLADIKSEYLSIF